MEEVSPGKGKQVADSKRRGGLAQRKIDEYDDDPGLHAEAQGHDSGQGERVPGGSGEGQGDPPGDGSDEGSDDSRLGCYRIWGQVLGGGPVGYPCAGCPGGLDYRLCCELRGVKK